MEKILNTALTLECLRYSEHHKSGNAVRIMTQHYLCFLLFPPARLVRACSETSHTPVPTCMRFGSALSHFAPPSSSSSPSPTHRKKQQ